jgi:hypothetical protein
MPGKISQDLTVPFKPSLYIPGVDLSLGLGNQNVKLLASSLNNMQVTPQQFGAVGDGVTDNTVAFNAALAALAAAGGGKLYIPAGSYRITGPLTYTAGALHITGDGKDSVLSFGSTTADLFTFAGPDMTLSDLNVTTPFQTSTAGTLFNFTDANNAKLSRIWTNGGYQVVQFLGAPGKLSYRTSINDCNFVNVMGNAVYYDPYFGGLGMIVETDILGAPTDQGSGIIIEAGDTFTFTNMNIAALKFGVLAISQTGGINYVANILATNVLCDGAGTSFESGLQDGWCFDGGAAGTYVSRIHLSSCWGGAMGRHGFNVENATDVTFTNCIGIGNQGNGFLVSAPSSDITLDGCTASWNSANNANDNDGIHIAGAVTDFIITGCRSKPNPETQNTQRAGIAIEPAASDRYIITNNNLHGNVTLGLDDEGTGATKFVSQNII